MYKGLRVIGVDPVPERRGMAARHGVETLDYSQDLAGELRETTDARGPDAVVDAVGIEAHGSPVAGFAHQALGLLPDLPRRPRKPRAWTGSPPCIPPWMPCAAPASYEKFQKKEDGCIKVVLNPGA